MYDAIYARQSVEKEDSVSIESQVELCAYETRGGPYKEYIDRGYSGKNTNRPAFARMLGDIKRGEISRVIVYKLDRISRSILDFANMMEAFGKWNVEFISSTEKFDTSAPIGRAMLNICIVFAQLERETIQKRVADAYYSRSKRGLYMGGRAPYGFSRADTVIDGIKTAMLAPVAEECEQVKLMFSMYADSANSLGDIVSHFNQNGVRHLRGGIWSTARLSDILRNPVYVRADADVYEFFREQGARIVNPVSDFTGTNGCYAYSGAASKTGKRSGLAGKELVLAPHEGIIPSYEWIRCRTRCLFSRQSAGTCGAKSSWLTGKVKCGRCGYGLAVVKAKTKWRRYFVCSAKLATKGGKCAGTGGTVYADVLESYVREAIGARLHGFERLCGGRERGSSKRNAYKIRLAQIDEQAAGLLPQVAGADAALLSLINGRARELEAERVRLRAELSALREADGDGTAIITNHADLWKDASFEDRQTVADVLIKVIRISDGSMEIIWNI